MTHRPSSGFTLIEVLIALLVIALGVGALLGTLTSSADAVAQLRDKSIAEWLALNRISEVRLSASRPGVGVSTGTVENYAGGRWRWQQTVSDPGMAGILRLEVKVAPMTGASATTSTAAESGDATQASSAFPALATAYGFLGTAVAPSTGVDPDWSLAAAATGGGAGTGGTGGGTTGGGTGGGANGGNGGPTTP